VADPARLLAERLIDRRIRPQNRRIRPRKPSISNPKWRTDASHVAHRWIFINSNGFGFSCEFPDLGASDSVRKTAGLAQKCRMDAPFGAFAPFEAFLFVVFLSPIRLQAYVGRCGGLPF
jgi:hypothetical protein